MDETKFTALEGLVTEVDAEGPATPEQIEAQAAQETAETAAQAWAAVPGAIGRLLGILAPELKAVYTAEACQEWGEAMQPVAEKYGWNGPGNVPEIGLAISTLGLAVPTYFVCRMKVAQIKAMNAKAAPKPAPEAAPGLATVAPVEAPAVDTSGAVGGG